LSSGAVRTQARSLAAASGWPAGLPFFETVNSAPSISSLPSTWFTLGFDGDSDDPISLGATPTYNELGRITLSLMGRAGLGDSAVIGLADQIPPLIRTHLTAASIATRGISPPQLVDDAAEGEFLRFDLIIEYQRFHS